MESTCEGTSEEGAEASKITQCIYQQGLGTFAQDDAVAL